MSEPLTRKYNMYKLFMLLIGLAISIPSFAHEGHDHSDPMSPLIHLLWVAPMVIGAGLLMTYIKRRFFAENKNNAGVNDDNI
jgi:hypothetical protein